jgi:hypothetical protein
VHERRSDEGKSGEASLGGNEPYEPPRLTVLGSFRDLTAGESQGDYPDDCGRVRA